MTRTRLRRTRSGARCTAALIADGVSAERLDRRRRGDIIARYPRRAVGPAAAAAPGAGARTATSPRPGSTSAQSCGRLTAAEVSAVATFYSMYRRDPTGEYLVGVCTNTLCAIMGGDAILDALTEHLDVRARRDHRRRQGHPRAHRVQCRVRLTPRGDGQLGVLRQPDPGVGTRPRRCTCAPATTVTPTRGAPLCTFRETARMLAGFPTTAARRRGRHGGRRHAGRPAGGARTRHARHRRRMLEWLGRNRIRRTRDRGRNGDGPSRARTRRDDRRRAGPRRDGSGAPTTADRRRTDMPLTPVLSRYWDEPESWTLDTYRRHDGYRGAARRPCAMRPRRRHRHRQGRRVCAVAAARGSRPG